MPSSPASDATPTTSPRCVAPGWWPRNPSSGAEPLGRRDRGGGPARRGPCWRTMRGLYVVVAVTMAGVSSVFALLAELEHRYGLPTASLGWIAGSAFAAAL